MAGRLAVRVRDLLIAQLPNGAPSKIDIAKMLGLSVASLRRHLTEEGTSFRELSRTKMNDRAKFLLDQGQSVQEVAEDLGFSDFRSFTRAFKSWNNMTPGSYLASR